MDKLRITGGRKLRGTVEVSGAKNAALPDLISALLSIGAVEFTRVPVLEDVRFTLSLLEVLGCTVERVDSHEVRIISPSKSDAFAPYDIVRKMRASVLVLGPLLARYHHAKVSLPGGCAIGARPIDLHLKGLEALGARLRLEEGYVSAECLGGLVGARFRFDFPSVGATENVLMAAALARGETVLENCAREPEIADLARSLISRGAKIAGVGSSTLTIQGVESLSGGRHEVMGDRIEAGTYLIAGLITKGCVRVVGIDPSTLESVLIKAKEAGARVETGEDWIECSIDRRPSPVTIRTEPFPGFPTDMQAQWMAWMSISTGAADVEETIFENRFMHVPELSRMGARVHVAGSRATVSGVEKLLAAPVMATDLRASASLILAALAADGTTEISRIYHLDRGYERLELKLSGLGASVSRITSTR